MQPRALCCCPAEGKALHNPQRIFTATSAHLHQQLSIPDTMQVCLPPSRLRELSVSALQLVAVQLLISTSAPVLLGSGLGRPFSNLPPTTGRLIGSMAAVANWQPVFARVAPHEGCRNMCQHHRNFSHRVTTAGRHPLPIEHESCPYIACAGCALLDATRRSALQAPL